MLFSETDRLQCLRHENFTMVRWHAKYYHGCGGIFTAINRIFLLN